MPNVSRIAGLSPVQYLNGSAWNGQARTYWINSTDTLAYAIGDPVASSGSGDATGVPGVTLATAGNGNAIRGVVVGAGGRVYGGFMGDAANLNTLVVPATKTRHYYVMVVDDPNVMYEVQEGTGTALSAAACGLNGDLASGTNNGYVSGWYLNNEATSTGSTYQLRLWGLVQRSDNAFGAYAKWLVTINNHELRPVTTGL